ncbi:hypothetical protein [Mobilicoccus caccae]|uniref:Secreted protein n=1 Tax=Mobilicoccus caccae TaxID=1859295 RepID=A0ABQ6ITX5_9MICO|nr:hypothetical protein [Mobilicoccus caccae]GMA40169.1 hypothetical protein GCM10025883_22140 [Mobilicoccus caccae]
MRAGRYICGTTAALLLASGMASAPSSTAAAAPAKSVTTTSTKGVTVATKTAGQYRVVRSAQLRRSTAALQRAATLKAVTKAVHSSEFTEGVAASAYSVRDLRTSGSWARVTLTPKQAAELDPATVLLRKTRSTWTVVDLGTAGVGCEVAPNSTLKALKLECA